MNFDRMPKVAAVGAVASTGSRAGGALANFFGRFFRRGLGRYLSGNVASSPVVQAATPWAHQAEKGTINFLSQHLPEYAPQIQRTLRGTFRPALREGYAMGMVGGALGGASGALTAEEGDRFKGFLRGAGEGALQGVVAGGISSVGSSVVRNRRAMALKNYAREHNMPAAQAGKQLFKEESFFPAVWNSFAGQTPVQRSMARQKALGGLGVVGATWVAPEIAMRNLFPSPPEPPEPPPPPPPPPAPKQPGILPNAPAVYYPQQLQQKTSQWDPLPHVDFSQLFSKR